MAWSWGNAAQGAAGGAASGAMMGMPAGGIGALPGALIGGVLGAVSGGLTGKDEQEIPEFNAAERAREYMRQYGGFGERIGAAGASADGFARRTAADLISAGVDPASAQNIASRRAAGFREKTVGDIINAASMQEAQLAGQLIPYEIQREEDRISLQNMRANEPTVLESFMPLVMSSAYNMIQAPLGSTGSTGSTGMSGVSGSTGTLQNSPLLSAGQQAGAWQFPWVPQSAGNYMMMGVL